VLRIDLLPRQIAIARTNKLLIALIIALLLIELGVLGAMLMGVKGQIATTSAELERVSAIADEVTKLEGEVAQKEGELAPIQAKVDFVDEANESGEQYWDRFHAINEYIYENAQMTRFSITGGSSVNFTVTVGDTTDAARFLLNIVHCPALSNVSVSGLPPGVSIEGAGGAMAGGFQPMASMEPGMEPGIDPGMEPGMDPGMAMGGPTPQASATGDITLDVTATLTEPIEVPVPGAGAAAAGGMPGMDPGMMDPAMMDPAMMDPAMAPEAGAAPPDDAGAEPPME
jgi:hypothetical protein